MGVVIWLCGLLFWKMGEQLFSNEFSDYVLRMLIKASASAAANGVFCFEETAWVRGEYEGV